MPNDMRRVLWLQNITQANLGWLKDEMKRMMAWELFDDGWTREIPDHLQDLFAKTFPERKVGNDDSR